MRIIKSFLEASYSIENAFIMSVRELTMLHGKDSMMVKEVKTIVSQLKLNKPIDKVFKNTGEKK